jgi:hypothetical protein
MDRRTFLYGLMFGTLGAPFAGEAEQTARTYRVGFLSSMPVPLYGRTHLTAAFEQGLRDAGYTRGPNLTIELRSPRSWVYTISNCESSGPKWSIGALT